MAHPVPFNETYRLEILEDLDAIDVSAEPMFERVSRLASQIFGTPMASVTLLDQDSQHMKGGVGLAATAMSREVGFCNHTILRDEAFVVTDAASDPRFSNNPIVTGDPFIRFYAGVPLITTEGLRLGALCVLDRAPRAYPDAALLARLRDLADMVIDLLEFRHLQKRTVAFAADSLSNLEVEAESGRRAKSEFIDMVSHELRTPLNAVIGFSDVMKNETFGPLPQPYREYSGLILSSAQNLLNIVDQVLTFSNLERAEISLEEGTVTPRQLSHQSASLIGPHLDDGGANIVWAVPDNLPSLYVDRTQVKQMLAHVVGNAVRFGGEAPNIHVTAKLCHNGTLAFVVRDDGPGIDADKVAEVLEPFRQATNGYTRQYDGIGLGLPLTRRLLDLHGGKLEIERCQAGGTQVSLIFPRWRVVAADL